MILLGVLLLVFGYMVLPFFAPAFFALIFVIIFNPVQRWFQSKFRGHRYPAAVVSTLVVCVVILLPLGFVISLVTTQLIEFTQTLLNQLQSGHLTQTIDKAGELVRQWLGSFTGSEGVDYNIKEALTAFLKDATDILYKLSPRMLTTTARVLVQAILMLVFMFGFFAEGQNIYDNVMELSPLASSHKSIFSREIRLMISATLAGTFVTGLVQGLFIGVGLAVAGISQPAMWGMVAVVMSFIPIIGAACVYVTAAAVLFVVGDTTAAIGILLFGFIVVSSVDNVVKPLVIRGKVRVHPILVLVSLLGGIKLFGPVGLIFGPVLLAVLLAALRIYRREFLPQAVA